MKNQIPNFVREMDVEKYANERVTLSIKNYHSKAAMCREVYLYSNLFAIILSSSIPILINLISINDNKYILTTISFLVVVIVALENVFHFRDRWKNYQIAEELIKREQYLFCTKSEPYMELNEALAYALFVNNVEAVIKDERDKTIQTRSSEIKISKERT